MKKASGPPNSKWWTPLPGHKSSVRCAKWNPEGDKLASGSSDKTARVWYLESKTNFRPLIGHTDSINHLSWDPNSEQHLATVSQDKSMRMWDLREEKTTNTLTFSEEVLNVAYSPMGNEIAVGVADDSLLVYDLRKITGRPTRKRTNLYMNEFVWGEGGEHLLVALDKGKVEVLDGGSSSLTTLLSLSAHVAKCQCIAMDQNHKMFAVGGYDGLVTLWDAKEMLCLQGFPRLDLFISDVSFNFDSTLIAFCSGGKERFIDVSEVSTGRAVHEFRTEKPVRQYTRSETGRDYQLPNVYKGMEMFCIDWHPKKNLLAVGASCEDLMHKADYPDWYRDRSPWDDCMFHVFEF